MVLVDVDWALDSGNSRIWPLKNLHLLVLKLFVSKTNLNTTMNSKFCSSNCLSPHMAACLQEQTHSY